MEPSLCSGLYSPRPPGLWNTVDPRVSVSNYYLEAGHWWIVDHWEGAWEIHCPREVTIFDAIIVPSGKITVCHCSHCIHDGMLPGKGGGVWGGAENCAESAEDGWAQSNVYQATATIWEICWTSRAEATVELILIVVRIIIERQQFYHYLATPKWSRSVTYFLCL